MGAIQSALPCLRTPKMLRKLKRSISYRVRRWTRKTRSHSLVADHSRRTCGGIRRKAVKCNRKHFSLQPPMPRCSSFSSQNNLMAASSEAKKRIGDKSADGLYAQWKFKFEKSSLISDVDVADTSTFTATAAVAAVVQRSCAVHDITEAISGQLTPKGFPSHTDVAKCQEICGEKRINPKARCSLSLRLPKLSQRANALKQDARANAKLQQDLQDLEDYYGAFNYIYKR